jgi:protein-disulfide isomerase
MNLPSNKYPAGMDGWVGVVELTEFGDFTCAHSRQHRALLTTILETFGGRIRYTYRHFPNPRNEAAMLAAVAAEAARRQDYFWPMCQALFTQPAISRTMLSLLSIQLGLNYNQFLNDLDDAQLWHHIEADRCEGYRLGVTTTPTLFIGGQRFHGKLTESRLTPIIHSHLDRVHQSILSRVDIANGIIYWGQGG